MNLSQVFEKMVNVDGRKALIYDDPTKLFYSSSTKKIYKFWLLKVSVGVVVDKEGNTIF